MRIYRLNAVGNDGRLLVLGKAETAAQALSELREAFRAFPRAWVTDERDEDVSLPDLLRLAESEQQAGNHD